jgi:D-hexose-6-phosphate mutarotase
VWGIRVDLDFAGLAGLLASRLHSLDALYRNALIGGAVEAENRRFEIAGEVDRVFLDTTTTCVVDDPVLARQLHVAKRDSRATVVWNPGRDRARNMRDVGEDGWRGFVCVETANVGPHAVRLAPRARHAMSARIDVTPFGERGLHSGTAPGRRS